MQTDRVYGRRFSSSHRLRFGSMDENTSAAVDRGDESYCVCRLDLRSFAATCCGASGDATGHCGGKKAIVSTPARFATACAVILGQRAQQRTYAYSVFRMIVFSTSERIRAFYFPVEGELSISVVPEPRTSLLLTFGTLVAISLFASRSLICLVKSVVRAQVPFRRWTTL
jgi:hypothetical protein